MLVGLLYANGIEYAYHRFSLHEPGTAGFARHVLHHQTVESPEQAEHINFGRSPLWVVGFLALNISLFIALELLFRPGLAAGVMAAFVLYFILTEEIHWRIHLGGWLPPGLARARAYHLSHHAQPNRRYNVFLPLFDLLTRQT